MDNFRSDESMKELIYRFGSEIIASSPLMRIPRFANAFEKKVWGRKLDVHYNFDMLSASSEREYLFNIASNLKKNSNILEIGTYRGGFTLFLSKGAEISKSKVYSIDPFDICPERQLCESDGSFFCTSSLRKPSLEEVKRNLTSNGVNGNMELIQGFSLEVSHHWNRPNIDFLFIDGNHKQAKQDYLSWRPHLNQGALVAFHDSNHPYYGRQDVTEDVSFLRDKGHLKLLDRHHSISLLASK